MPTLTSEMPDTLDLDYFYRKCSDTFGVAFYEEDSKNVIPILSKSKPITCLTKTLRSNIKCKLTNNNHKLTNDAIFHENEAYHYACLPNNTTNSFPSNNLSSTSLVTYDFSSTRKDLTSTFKKQQQLQNPLSLSLTPLTST